MLQDVEKEHSGSCNCFRRVGGPVMEVTFAAGLSTTDLTEASPKAADGSGSNRAVGGGDEMDQYSLVKKAVRTEADLSVTAGSDSGSSKYIVGLMESYKSEKAFKTKMDSLVGVLASAIPVGSKYTQAMLTRTRAEQLVRQSQNDEIMEESEDQLEETRDDMDESGSVSGNGAEGSEQATESGDQQQASSPQPEDAPLVEPAVVAGAMIDLVV